VRQRWQTPVYLNNRGSGCGLQILLSIHSYHAHTRTAWSQIGLSPAGPVGLTELLGQAELISFNLAKKLNLINAQTELQFAPVFCPPCTYSGNRQRADLHAQRRARLRNIGLLRPECHCKTVGSVCVPSGASR